jgi:hypothetical protein
MEFFDFQGASGFPALGVQEDFEKCLEQFDFSKLLTPPWTEGVSEPSESDEGGWVEEDFSSEVECDESVVSVDSDQDPELSKLVRDVPDRFQGKHVFLTYAKCNLSKEEFETKFKERLPEKSRYFGGRELHRDGVPHFHVLVEVVDEASGLFRTRAKKQFDIAVEGTNGHPHWQYPRDLFAVQEYCGKEHDVFGEKFVEESEKAVLKRKFVEVFKEETADLMHSKMREIDPEQWTTRYLNYNAAFEHMAKKRRLACDSYVLPADCSRPWKLYSAMERWLTEEFNSVKVWLSGDLRGGCPPKPVTREQLRS